MSRDEEFGAYVAGRRPHLFRSAWLLCGDPHRAEDLVQEALAKLYVAWPRVSRVGNLDAYVRRMLVNGHIDETRRPWRRERPTEQPLDTTTTPGPGEESDELWVALRALPAGQRRAVVLRHYWGLSIEETANDLGVGTGTVKSQTSAALASLRRSLMDDFDLLGNQLHELAQRAPVPVADPLLDIRRGRRAVRRRHVRDVAGVSAALVAVAAIATTFPSLQLFGGDGTITASTPAYSTSSTSSPPTSSRPTAATDPCTINGGTAVAEARQRAPEVAAAVAAYREAAAATLDPSGEHLDPADSKRPESVQSSSYCDPEVGEQLASLGAKIGWTEDGALGVIQLEVVSPGHDVEPQIVLNHSGWAAYGGRLPTGVSKARVTNYSKDGGGHAVIVERFDGLSVAIDAAATWGNNAAPGSPPTTDLPGVKKLVQLAADPALTLPKL